MAIGRQDHPDAPSLVMKLDDHVIRIGLDTGDEVDLEADPQALVVHDLDEVAAHPRHWRPAELRQIGDLLVAHRGHDVIESTPDP